MNKKDLDNYRVKPGQKVDLSKWNPNDDRFFSGKKKDASDILKELNLRLESLQELLFAEHKHTPGKGEIVIFNRSHYEDVLVVRVHSLVPEKIWKSRFDHIFAFEKMLADEGTTILKFYLHIDQEEQKQRFLSRIETSH